MKKKQQLNMLLNRPEPVNDDQRPSQSTSTDTNNIKFTFKDIEDSMEMFDGNNVDIVDWLAEYEETANIFNWT